MRGGVSTPVTRNPCASKSSPRAWGCFCGGGRETVLGFVFPTCVGVFPASVPVLKPTHRSSPRAWGCFPDHIMPTVQLSVFPTCVGVFPTVLDSWIGTTSLPHVRGGVSNFRISCLKTKRSSPRAWGCFTTCQVQLSPTRVFPTCVGVFLFLITPETVKLCLPHVRGGVSVFPALTRWQHMSSPRAWGCFYQAFCIKVVQYRLPHVRGGVSLIPGHGQGVTESSPRAWGCFAGRL